MIDIQTVNLRNSALTNVIGSGLSEFFQSFELNGRLQQLTFHMSPPQ
jgi:hypothetical protein